MQTAGKVIEKALKRILVQAADVAIEADETSDALDALNDYMASLESRGIYLGYTPVTNVSEFVTVPDGAINGIVANLAIEVAADFNGVVSPSLQLQARHGMQAIRRLGQPRVSSQFPVTLPTGSGNDYTVLDDPYYRGTFRAFVRLIDGFSTPFAALNTPVRLLGEWRSQYSEGLAGHVSGRVQNILKQDITGTATAELTLSGSGDYTVHIAKEGVSIASGSLTVPGSITITTNVTMEPGESLDIRVEADTVTDDITATLGELRVD